MLQVTLHLVGGHTLTLALTRHQKERIVRSITAPDPPGWYVAEIDGERVEVPWRSIAYVSSKEAV